MDSVEEKNEVESSQPLSQIIQPINRDTVHRICSGQVVLSLAIAVKELIENSIDAAATIIDIRLKEYGADLIEVSDNGTGVMKENFQALTLKHYTSKIKQFNDLETITTLGFRGEALSSLCALSDLTVLTKHSTVDHATKITYDRNGKIVNEILSARETGTTVILENLFSTLPVRQKEFLKNLKREFNKMCQLLYAYCLVSKGIKFSCINITRKGSKNTVVSTEGLNTVRENIINVFGAKQISSLIEIEIIRPDESISDEYGLNLAEGEPLPFTFEFFISSVMHGSGRSTNDRQFYFINSRPCDPTKIIKLVNEIYKQYNSSQYPFVYLNIKSVSSLVDVNVTPDKRQIFLEKEKILLATIKMSLIEAFKSFPSTFKMQNLELSQNSTIIDFFGNSDNNARGLKRSNTDGDNVKKGSITERFKKRSRTENDKDSLKSSIISFVNKVELNDSMENNESDHSESKKSKIESTTSLSSFSSREKQDDATKIDNLDSSDVKLDTFVQIATDVSKDELDVTITEEKSDIVCHLVKENTHNKVSASIDFTELDKKDLSEIKAKNIQHEDTKFCDDTTDDVELIIDTTVRNLSNRKSVTLNITLDDVRNSLIKKNDCKRNANSDIKVRFRSKITPDCNKTAEEELQKQIFQEDFKKMAIIGQFNLGFIITKLKNDLFIIDQHATDEKYNFEQLQANTVLENQKLVNPKQLELTAGNECLLIENEEIFTKNGFTFNIDHSAPCTKKISLTAIPISKNFVFGKDDIDEMLFMLQDSNHTMCRPSRIRGMFASRACRKSVMIGKSLSKSDMRKLVDHMSEIEKPWNCPHGRPTMRHLINLDLINKD